MNFMIMMVSFDMPSHYRRIQDEHSFQRVHRDMAVKCCGLSDGARYKLTCRPLVILPSPFVCNSRK